MKAGWLTPKGYMRNSAKPGMIDDPEMYASYALYLSKYVAAYKAAGAEIRKKATPSSAAIDVASSVLPHPGGPWSSSPRGGSTPRWT